MSGETLIERVKRKAVKLGASPSSTFGVVSSWIKSPVFNDSDGDRDIVAIMTTDSVDLDDEVVLPGGADLKTYLSKNGSVFIDHRYTMDMFAGKIRYVKRIPNDANPVGIEFRARILDSPHSKAASLLWDIAKQFGVGASIGFEATNYGPPSEAEKVAYPSAKTIVREWRAIEVSYTMMPCNVTCQGRAVTDASKSSRIVLSIGREKAGKLGLSLPRLKVG